MFACEAGLDPVRRGCLPPHRQPLVPALACQLFFYNKWREMRRNA
jgi:hypothetical protein